MDQGKCKSDDSITSVWKAINTKGRKNNVCSLGSRTHVEGQAVNGLDVELPTAFVKSETHQCRQGLKMSRDVQQRIRSVNSADADCQDACSTEGIRQTFAF